MTPEQRGEWVKRNPDHYGPASSVAQEASAGWRRLGFPLAQAHSAALAAVDLYIITVDHAQGVKK